jgi:peptidoglycan/xylan/chitin deacetylase (PgdA/CDA1 family)
MTDLIDYVYNDIKLPPNPIIISFDDGYLSTYKYVFPLLKKYNVKIVLSIVGKSTDDFSRVCDTNINYAHLTWDVLKEMKQSGLVEIQDHSYNMHKVSNGRYGCGQKYNEPVASYEKIITEDVTKFQERLKAMTDCTANTFTYPYGKYNDHSEDILKKLGFKASLSCKYGINLITKDPDKLYGLMRISRYHNVSAEKTLNTALKTLKYVKG